MATRINPPIFNKAKNYERFRTEVLAWREITDLKEDKQGKGIALPCLKMMNPKSEKKVLIKSQ